MSPLTVDGVSVAIAAHRILPVVVINDASRSSGLAEALQRGGLPCVEVTMRTTAALDAIRALSNEPALLVGAGTVLTVSQADEALEAGAQFIVTPGLSETVIQRCLDLGVAVFPGVATPTELLRALEMGIRIVKFFPAEVLGGVEALRALSAPFPMMRFIPTGGVNEGNLTQYLNEPSVAAVGGTWLARSDVLDAGSFEEIENATARGVALVTSSRSDRHS